jgi:hypothetical protein
MWFLSVEHFHGTKFGDASDLKFALHGSKLSDALDLIFFPTLVLVKLHKI